MVLQIPILTREFVRWRFSTVASSTISFSTRKVVQIENDCQQRCAHHWTVFLSSLVHKRFIPKAYINCMQQKRFYFKTELDTNLLVCELHHFQQSKYYARNVNSSNVFILQNSSVSTPSGHASKVVPRHADSAQRALRRSLMKLETVRICFRQCNIQISSSLIN